MLAAMNSDCGSAPFTALASNDATAASFDALLAATLDSSAAAATAATHTTSAITSLIEPPPRSVSVPQQLFWCRPGRAPVSRDPSWSCPNPTRSENRLKELRSLPSTRDYGDGPHL